MAKSKENGLLDKAKGKGIQKFFSLAALILVFSVLGQNFFSKESFINILDSSYYIGFMAIGVTFVIVTGGMDLSIGTVMMCATLIGGVAFNVWGWPIWATLILVVVIATLFGLVNGILIAKLKLPPFIATMGTMLISQGLGSIIAKVQTQRYPTAYEQAGWFKSLFFKTESGFPTGIVFLAIFFVIAMIVLNKTRIGRYAFAIGSNEEAVRLSGVDVKKWEMLAFIICGVLVGMGAIFYVSAYTTVQPGYGDQYNNEAIAGCVMGGTSMAGGLASISGTIIGVFIIALLQEGILALGFTKDYQLIITGVIVIVAVFSDVLARRRKN